MHSFKNLLLVFIFGFIIAGVGFYLATNRTLSVPANHQQENSMKQAPAVMASEVEKVDDETEVMINEDVPVDHVRGNKESRIQIVEYSDFECPYCRKLHPTLTAIVAKYPKDVSWVYKHFPLSEHKNSHIAAQASECVALIAGEDKFWEYGDSLFANASTGLNQTKLIKLVNDISVDGVRVEECLDSREMKSLVDSNHKDGLNAGVIGTPGMVLIVDGKVEGLMPGALPQTQLEEIIGRYL